MAVPFPAGPAAPSLPKLRRGACSGVSAAVTRDGVVGLLRLRWPLQGLVAARLLHGGPMLPQPTEFFDQLEMEAARPTPASTAL